MKTRMEIEAEAADFADRFRAATAQAEADKRPSPPGWLLDKWAQEKLKGIRR